VVGRGRGPRGEMTGWGGRGHHRCGAVRWFCLPKGLSRNRGADEKDEDEAAPHRAEPVPRWPRVPCRVAMDGSVAAAPPRLFPHRSQPPAP
jgi:hypothetical protein